MARSYVEEFNAKEYLDAYYASGAKGNPNEEGQYEFYSEQQYSFYKKYSCKWNKKTARLLKFGGGAVVSNLIISAPYVNQITFAAYLESAGAKGSRAMETRERRSARLEFRFQMHAY